MSSKIRFVAATLSATALLALSGCGGDDPLEPTASGEPSSTPTKAANVSLDIPAGAKEHTAAGGVEFTKFWFDQVNKAFSTGDILPVIKITSSGCIVCRQTIGDIAFGWGRGSIQGGKFTLKDVKAENQADDLHSLSFSYDEDALTELDPTGGVIWKGEAKKNIDMVVQIKWENGGWLMSQLVPNTKVKKSDDDKD